jgi:hypothetical protein
MTGRSSEQAGVQAASTAPPTTHEKALRLNIDAAKYGSFAEIGAGQEVARWFFRVGGAAGTVAKTISAYDTAVSDALYGPADRYVSRQRLQAMLEREYALLLEGLAARRGDRSAFFALADTVATRSYSRHENGHGWLGIRFQMQPGAEPSDVLVHVYLLDEDPAREQEALGIVGVNLVHGAFYHHAEPARLVESLMDGVERQRVEIDMVKLAGPAFGGFDNRLASLQLVELGFTDAAMLTADGDVVQPSEVLYKRPLLVERGTFRPPTKVTLALLDSARERFLREPDLGDADPVILLEMTLASLAGESGIDHRDFLDRAEVLHALGHHVLISRTQRNFALVEILSRYTRGRIGVALGLPTLQGIISGEYEDLAGGRLEAVGRLFKTAVKLYVYPTVDAQSGALIAPDTMQVPEAMHHLYRFLLENRRVEALPCHDASILQIRTRDVLARLQRGDLTWESAVPDAVATIIKQRGLFGLPQPP